MVVGVGGIDSAAEASGEGLEIVVSEVDKFIEALLFEGGEAGIQSIRASGELRSAAC